MPLDENQISIFELFIESLRKIKIEINDKVIDNISTSNNPCELNYSKLVFDNKELQSNFELGEL